MQPLTILLTVAFVVIGMSLLAASGHQDVESPSHPEVVRTAPIQRQLPVEPLEPDTHDSPDPERTDKEPKPVKPT